LLHQRVKDEHTQVRHRRRLTAYVGRNCDLEVVEATGNEHAHDFAHLGRSVWRTVHAREEIASHRLNPRALESHRGGRGVEMIVLVLVISAVSAVECG